MVTSKPTDLIDLVEDILNCLCIPPSLLDPRKKETLDRIAHRHLIQRPWATEFVAIVAST